MRYLFTIFATLFAFVAIADDDQPTRVNRAPGILYPPSEVPVGDQAALYVNLDPVPFPEVLRKAKPVRIEDPNGSSEE